MNFVQVYTISGTLSVEQEKLCQETNATEQIPSLLLLVCHNTI